MTTLPTLPANEIAPMFDDPSKDAGFGALTTGRGALPLVALEVNARLDGLFGGVELRQTFVNPHDVPLEATYIFPLPDRAAVTRFRLEVAGRVVEGELQERGKAREEYDKAIQAGHRAAIAEEERPGVFTMRVGNLPPGERADVQLSLVGPLSYKHGEVTFHFPLVVAPRYVPGVPLPGPSVGEGIAPDTDQAPDASRISPPVLLRGFPSPVRLRLGVEVATSPLGSRDFRSSLHTVLTGESAQGHRFHLQPGERLDRDFVLRYRIGADRPVSSLTVQPDAEGQEGTFLLTLLPPSVSVKRRPRAVVFVLDRSGSMGGWKMVAARRAVARMVETLTHDDRFSIYAFDSTVETPPGFDGLTLVPGSERQRFRASEYLRKLDARGGTEMAEPLLNAVRELNRAGVPEADRVLVLITDGQVGNEAMILRQLAAEPRVRIFTLGIDQAVNASFLSQLADLGGGGCEFVESEGRLDAVMDSINRRIGTPILTGLELVGEGLEIVRGSVMPARLPDLFDRVPVTILGRYRGSAEGAISLKAQEGWMEQIPSTPAGNAPLSLLWGRAVVRHLEDCYAMDTGDRAKLEHDIVATSLRFGVLSRFTAFVAVDRSEVVNAGGQQKLVTQPVELPAGWGQPSASAAGSILFSAPAAGQCNSAPRGLMRHALCRADRSAAILDESIDKLSVTMCGADPGNTATAFGPNEPEAKAKSSSGPGLLSRLIQAVFGGGGAPGPKTTQEAIRAMGVELVAVIDGGADDSLVRRLSEAKPELDALLQLMRDAGEDAALVAVLEGLSAELGRLLAEATPRVEALSLVRTDLLRALLNWLKPSQAEANCSTEPPRKAFWK